MPRSLRTPEAASRQLRNFTNRNQELAKLRRVLDLPEGTPLPVLMFWGVGGNGKSWLLQKLRATLPPGLPSALLDLDPLTGGTPYQANSSRALAELRRQLESVAFPRFDLAYAWLRFKEGVKDEPLLKGSGTAAKLFEFITDEAPSMAEGIPGVSWLLKRVAEKVKKHLKDTRLEAWLAEQAGQEDFQQLRHATTQDLYEQLADRFLHDAAENLPPLASRACRGVVFLDTFEALRQGVPGQAQAHDREAWVRSLHAKDSPLLLVLAGRDRLRWDEHDHEYADLAYLEQHFVGGLSEGDAREFLRKCGVPDGPLQDAVLRVSKDVESVPADGAASYHSFSLGLCADAIQAEFAQGRAVAPETFDMAPGDTAQLTQRFFKSLGDPAHEIWVRRLALTPRFDEAAARAAFSPNPGAPQDAAWQALRRYSFVRDTDDPGWWTLHSRMRDVVADLSPRPGDHPYWVHYWSARSASDTDDCAALSWYHRYCLTPAEAGGEWGILEEQLLQQCRMAEHQTLLSWWEPTGITRAVVYTPETAASLSSLGVGYWGASLGNRAENLRRAIACQEAALRVYTEADFPREWGTTQKNLGSAYAGLPTGVRAENLRRAIGCYEAALRFFTEAEFPRNWASTQNNLGNA